MTEQPDVSRETKERLEVYLDLLAKWNPTINLVSKNSLNNIWSRHLIDSIQLSEIMNAPTGHWADIGSGGGFPGLVIAILASASKSPMSVTLVESDSRKCAFLRTVIRETGISARVLNDRIEALDGLDADVLSARALADLDTLLGFADRHLKRSGTAIFPKGATWKKELEVAQRKWFFDLHLAKSKTDADAVIMAITGVSRVRSNAP
ncbi:16S rRNA (guanine(527)-N(7))-methyltransferase RsmG [uncultured Roseovarius sp.]|uniref:16S rRNA (guanine(527)-N(7))-methyltransferase RsmG n=1 Tax=uncultured Roseovarius sp. TaxID=293344 RepID=UPI002625F6EC|nr:16S rRNA (guanine(527)-N(7))-methyltransferase RsmG [uncultured Roseovarius sp.]